MGESNQEKLLDEVRNRVSDILAAVQLLTPLVQEKGGQEDRKYLAAMNKSLYRLMRAMRHIEAYDEESIFQPQPLDLAGLCRDVGRQMEPMAERLGIEFDWRLEDSSVIGMADDHLLELALLNMLTNALEAAGKGGRVTLHGEVKDGRWRVSIGDDGPGFTPVGEEENPLLKQPGGLGLGLVAARHAAFRHGGVLMLENSREGGLRAVLSLPIQKPDKADLLLTQQPKADLWGGFSPVLVELSPILPLESYFPEDVD